MHLLNIKNLKLEIFFVSFPPYAILSHSWGPAEVTFQDLDRDGLEQKAGWTKILGFCETATKFSSLTELSEAINAMFRWYREPQCCFAYLKDVSLQGTEP
ncbi:hypothetical protein FZEAL_9801, partial [Fusarium zealandicum]